MSTPEIVDQPCEGCGSLPPPPDQGDIKQVLKAYFDNQDKIAELEGKRKELTAWSGIKDVIKQLSKLKKEREELTEHYLKFARSWL